MSTIRGDIWSLRVDCKDETGSTIWGDLWSRGVDCKDETGSTIGGDLWSGVDCEDVTCIWWQAHQLGVVDEPVWMAEYLINAYYLTLPISSWIR